MAPWLRRRGGARGGRAPPDRRASRIRELGIVGRRSWLLIARDLRSSSRASFDADSLRNLALNAAIFATSQPGQTLVLVTRNVDLSGQLRRWALSAFMAGDAAGERPIRRCRSPCSCPPSCTVSRRGGCVLLNGFLVTYGAGACAGRHPGHVVRLPRPGVPVDQRPSGQRRDAPRTVPEPRQRLDRGVPTLALIALVVVLVVGQWLRDYRAGRELYAIGSNPEGARLAGVRSQRRVLAAFVLAGALAGLGGVLFTARFGTVDATAGVGYELTVIAAAVVGGVAISAAWGPSTAPPSAPLCSTTITFVADRPEGSGLLATGRRSVPCCSVGHRARSAARGARRGGSAPQERAPCRLSGRRRPRTPLPVGRRDAGARLGAARSVAGRRCSSACCWPPRSRGR